MKTLARFWLVGMILLAACSSGSQIGPVPATPATVLEDIPATVVLAPTSLPTVESTLLPRIGSPTQPATATMPAKATEAQPTRPPAATPTPDGWESLPVIPQISPRVIQIYQKGLELGNHPQAFSKIGDCGSTPAWFLGDFDRGEKFYRLGDHTDLEAVIGEFQGSYARTSLAAKSGFNVSSVLSPFWSDSQQCLANETPLACEVRVHRPSFAFIMLGTNDVFHPESFEPGLRQIIEYLVENGVIPILSTKADNLEGDGSINATIARLAQEYEVPLLNFWASVQSLPEQGLQEDHAHITYGQNFFDDPDMLQTGWTVRNLTALQALDAAWRAIEAQP